jgi:hypothetical protein
VLLLLLLLPHPATAIARPAIAQTTKVRGAVRRGKLDI